MKKDRELVRQESEKLYQEIIDTGYSEELAKTISEELAKKGNYLFNKSHSFSYAVLTLQTAYLKAVYPAHFFKALFNINKSKAGAINKYIVDAHDFNVSVLPPHINRSDVNFTVYDDNILFGLSAIAGIGETVAQQIVEERNAHGKYRNLKDLIERVEPTKAQIIALIKAGAIPTKNKRQTIIEYLKSQYKPIEFTAPQKLPPYKKLIADYGIDVEKYRIGTGKYAYDKDALLGLYIDFKKQEYDAGAAERFEKYKAENSKYLENEDFWEFEALQIFIGDNPFLEADAHIEKSFNITEIGDNCVVIGIISKIQKKKDKNKNQFCFINIYTSYGLIEGVVWSSDYKKYEDMLNKGTQICVYGTKTSDENITINNMKLFTQWCKDRKIKVGE